VTDPVKPGKKKKKADEKTDGEETDKGGKKSEKEGSKDKEKAAADDKKKKRKIRLDMHLDQVKIVREKKSNLFTTNIFGIHSLWVLLQKLKLGSQNSDCCRQVVFNSGFSVLLKVKLMQSLSRI
jgi:hypothetical protein